MTPEAEAALKRIEASHPCNPPDHAAKLALARALVEAHRVLSIIDKAGARTGRGNISAEAFYAARAVERALIAAAKEE